MKRYMHPNGYSSPIQLFSCVCLLQIQTKGRVRIQTGMLCDFHAFRENSCNSNDF